MLLLPLGIRIHGKSPEKNRATRSWGRVPGSNPGGPATLTIPTLRALDCHKSTGSILDARIISTTLMKDVADRVGDPKFSCCQPSCFQSSIELSFCSSAHLHLTLRSSSFLFSCGLASGCNHSSGRRAQFFSSSGFGPVTHSVA